MVLSFCFGISFSGGLGCRKTSEIYTATIDSNFREPWIFRPISPSNSGITRFTNLYFVLLVLPVGSFSEIADFIIVLIPIDMID